MEEYYYRCKQILEEILTTQGFTAQAETIALGRSIDFIKDDLVVDWSYDLRDQTLFLEMRKNKKRVGTGAFGSAEQLKKGFLAKLEEILNAQRLAIPEQNRRLANDDLVSFQTEKTKKSLFAGLFGGKSSR
jgi:hypothetical protein